MIIVEILNLKTIIICFEVLVLMYNIKVYILLQNLLNLIWIVYDRELNNYVPTVFTVLAGSTRYLYLILVRSQYFK